MKGALNISVLTGLLVLLIDGALTQSTASSSIVSINVFFTNVTYSDHTDLTNRSSPAYNSTAVRISQGMMILGGGLETVAFSDGGGCLKVLVEWRNINQSNFFKALNSIKDTGIAVNNQTWAVSFNSCGRDTLVMLKFYAVGLPWSPDYSNEGSDKYNALRNLLIGTFSRMDGSLRTLRLQDNQGCVFMYIELDSSNQESVLAVTSKIVTSGLNISGQLYNVTTKPCINSTVITDQCPVVKNDIVNNSQESCNATSCEPGYGCCSYGSTKMCMPVGYKVKIAGALLLDTAWTDAFNNWNKQSNFSKAVRSLILNTFDNQTVKAVDLVNISRYVNKNQTSPLLHIDVYFTEDLSNQDIFTLPAKLVNRDLQVESGKANITSARFGSQNIIHAPGMCGDELCYGVCKRYIDGKTFCSCSSGYYGSDCYTFDCRKDPTTFNMNTTVNLCMNSGTCSRSDSGFHCKCPSGFYGDYCEVKLCDFMVNPCGGQGSCVGDIREGNLCQCNPGRGGLFCEKNESENVTLCERKLSVMRYINESIYSDFTGPSFTLSFKDVLKTIMLTQYEVQTCNVSDNTTLMKQSNTHCSYDSETGRQLGCTCTLPNGTASGYFYYGPGDCRDGFNAQMTKIDLFIDSDWPDESRKYLIESRIRNVFQRDSGYITSFIYSGRPGCIGMHFEVTLQNPGNLNVLLWKIKEQGVQTGGKSLTFTDVSCDISDGSTLIDFKLPVAYLNWTDSFKDHTSKQYAEVKTAVEQALLKLTGSLRSLEITQGPQISCVILYVQWQTNNVGGFLSLMDTIRTTGLQISNTSYNVGKQPCAADDSNMVEFKLFIVKLLWTRDYSNNQSDAFTSLQKALSGSLKDLGGALKFMYLTQRSDCTEVFVQWSNFNASRFLPLMESLRMNGLQLNGQNSTVSTKSCAPETPLVMLLWNLTLDQPFSALVDVNKSKDTLENQLNEVLMSFNLTGYNRSRIAQFASSADTNKARAKRQSANIVCIIETNFTTSDIPVNKLYDMRKALISRKLGTYSILNITFGYTGPCPSEECFNMSICVNANRALKCACPDMYYGKTCAQRNTTLVCSNTTVCNSDREKCLRNVTCTGNKCEDSKVGCIGKERALSCDLKPCANSTSGMCDPCNGRGVCYNRVPGKGNSPWSSGKLDYLCVCDSGFSGDACETNNAICEKVPKGFCKHGCLGDLDNGQLCQCPSLYGGIHCNKLARSTCEQQKAISNEADMIQNLPNYPEEIKTILKKYANALRNVSCNPGVCDKVICPSGERCMAESANCSAGSQSWKCSVGVCRAIGKPGSCPRQDMNLFNKMLSGENVTCSPGACYDDSDCPGDEKCCGFCDSRCVQPAALYKCSDQATAATEQNNIADKSFGALPNLSDAGSDSYIALQRFVANRALWVPRCKDGYLYEPLQCFNASTNQLSCFCVDQWGKRIVGSKPNATDSTSCDVKPFTCPVLEPPANFTGYINCSGDLSCKGEDKCCPDGVGRTCATPVDESQLITVIDQLMMNACKSSFNICSGNAICSDKWKSDGKICGCSENQVGIFCENSTVQAASSSVCMRKALVYETLRNGKLISINNMSNTLVLPLILPNFNYTTEAVSAVDYTCLANGSFAPTQCVRYHNVSDLRSEVKAADCFCVDINGQEILGTRVSSRLGLPFCGEKAMCPRGNAFSDANGNPQECGSNPKTCPAGYACKRSTYGKMVCCPTPQALDNICTLPQDQGSANCTSVSSGTKYFFNDTAKECQSFTYKGCVGNNNRFDSLEDCKAQCIQSPGSRPGTCPSSDINVAKGQCRNKCSSDRDCALGQKCCKVNCANQCVPAIDESNKNLACPVGQSRGPCNGTTCAAGLYCNKGVCCIQYKEGADFCSVPPAMGEQCGEAVERYFFNSSAKRCQKFTFTGCQKEFNNFATLEDCCQSCGKEGRCKQGECPAVKLGSVISCNKQCSADGECPGKMICCSSGCGNMCVLPEVSSNVSDCLARQMEAKVRMNLNPNRDAKGCNIIHVPKCEADGSWSKLQCQPTLGVCWCVTPQGNYINDSKIKGVPPCDKISDTQLAKADMNEVDVASVDFSICPSGSSPRCCPAALCHRPCAAYPNATCVVDPCNGCALKYYNESGDQVECSKELSPCEKEVDDLIATSLEAQITAMLAMNMSLDDEDMQETNTSSSISSLVPGVPTRCQLPVDPGTCKGQMPQWYYDPSSSTCKMFIWGMCGGNENRFSSPDACYQTCNIQASPCYVNNCSSSNPCMLEPDETCMMGMMCDLKPKCKAARPTGTAMGLYIPECTATGQYNFKQCYAGYCWCVYENGTYRDGITNKNASALECSSAGANSNYGVDNCSNSQPINQNCVRACNKKVCPGHPTARCVVDMCSTNCDTKFVDASGNNVSCGDDQCKVFSFSAEKQLNCTAPSVCANPKSCPESICQRALRQNCSRNPCAICLTDPCTCQPYFVDALTNNNLTTRQCTFLSQGTCAIKACNVKKDAEYARLARLAEDDNVNQSPQCTAKGRFEPKQCVNDVCNCVDAFGQVVNTTSVNSTCKAIEPIKRIKSTFTFAADFKKFQQANKLGEIKQEIRNKLIELGIDPLTIKSISDPYEGSIKVDIVLAEDPNSANPDMNLIFVVLLQGPNITIIIGNDTLYFVPSSDSVSAQTQDEPVVPVESSSGLSERDKIIIGCVVGIGGGLILIAIIILCVCCYCKKRKPKSSAYDPIGVMENPSFDKAPARMNQAYVADDDANDRYIKVKL